MVSEPVIVEDVVFEFDRPYARSNVEFICKYCGRAIAVVKYLVNVKVYVNNLLKRINYKCPFCGKELREVDFENVRYSFD